MDDPWKALNLAAVKTLNPLWNDFAQEGRESAVLAPFARYPKAGAWLARSMGMSSDYKTRKLAAMLGGWIQDPKYISILSEMLNREREVFRGDSLSANSVVEDIMFAATRWTESNDAQVREGGIEVLATMVRDALEGTAWNTVNWAVANLYHATQGMHEVFQRLLSVEADQVKGQKFFLNAIRAMQEKDMPTLTGMVPAPSRQIALDSNDPQFSTVNALWKAAAAAEVGE